MAITREKKESLVNDLVIKLEKSKSVIFTDYRGLTVEDIDTVRDELRKQNIEYKIIKNTLLKLAIQESSLDIEAKTLDGHPIAAAFSYIDEVAPAKITYDFSKKNEKLEILGGILEGAEINAFSVKSLAQIPGREELYSRIVGSLAAPMSGLLNVMSGNTRGLINVLNAYKEKRCVIN